MRYSVYSISLSGAKQYVGITADFEARPDRDLADAARDEPSTWIGAQLKSRAVKTTKEDFRVLETLDTLSAAVAVQIKEVAGYRAVMRDPWYDEIPPGYYPAEDGVESLCPEFARRYEKPYPRPWMSDEAAVDMERDIMWNSRDAARVFNTRGDVADLLAQFYCETLINRRTWVSVAAAYDPRTRKVVFKTGGTYPDDWDAATPAEFAETAATWICDRAEQFALRLLSGARCDNPRIDTNAMRTRARDALRIMYKAVDAGVTALDVTRTRLSPYMARKMESCLRGDLVHTIREFMVHDMDEGMRRYNIKYIIPKDHPSAQTRKTAPPLPTRQLPTWPPIVVPAAFTNLGKPPQRKTKKAEQGDTVDSE